MNFLIITPTRNEGKYINETIKCMVNQTMLPQKWIIVNDGSTDNTNKIISDAMKSYDFIEYINLTNRRKRRPGRGVIEAFYAGLEKVNKEDYDVIAKFDSDLSFPFDTIERISDAFIADPLLGITGGVRYEQLPNGGPFKLSVDPKGFVGGPFKFYRKQCFEDIGGLIRRAGWDGVDLIKANMKGWKTYAKDSIKIIHLKPTGTAKGEGLEKAAIKYGDASYYMGGYFWYFFLKAVRRSLEMYSVKFGYTMLKAYIKSAIDNGERESKEFRKFLKKKQIENCIYWVKYIFNFKRQRTEKFLNYKR